MNQLKCFLTVLLVLLLSACSDKKTQRLQKQVAALSNQVANLADELARRDALAALNRAALSNQVESLAVGHLVLSAELDRVTNQVERLRLYRILDEYSRSNQMAWAVESISTLWLGLQAEESVRSNQTAWVIDALSSLRSRAQADTPQVRIIPAPTVSEYTVPAGVSPQAIESKIDGDFDGWDGETIVKLINGQIWQQTEYYYWYHYAFMPDVVIYRSAGGYKMKVEGIDKAVQVQRLK